MNRRLPILVFTLCALPVLAQGAEGHLVPDQAVAVAGVSPGSALNVREGPGTTHPVVSTLPANRAGLTIIDCADAMDWCRIGRDGTPLGWVAARYLAAAPASVTQTENPSPPPFSEAQRLAAATGITPHSRGWTPVPGLPPYLLGPWDIDARACARPASETRILILKNGVRIGAATARFKNAVFRDDGYDLTTLLMEEQDIPNAVPQRAQYRLEPGETTLTISGDVLETRRLRRCDGE